MPRLLQSDEIISRLVFDSISLSSHILRRNIGSFKIRRNSLEANNTRIRNDSYNSRIFTHLIQSELELLSPQKIKRNSNEILHRQKKSLLPRINKQSNSVNDNLPISFLSHNSAERDRLYFELKNFETSSKQREIEEELETLITEQLEANRLQLKAETGRHLPFQNTTLRHPTWFGAKYGDGLVLSSGVRRFDFLLLDWSRKERALKAILKVKDTSYNYLKVSIFQLF